MYQMLGYPEAILYVLLFIGILYVSIKYAHRKIITLLSILIMALICFLGIMSFVMAISLGCLLPCGKASSALSGR